MSTQQINGFAMHYLDKGNGLPVVLMHGFPLDSRIFNHQLESLSKDHRAILPDLRGFGQSTSVDRFSLNQLAEEVHTLLGRLGALPCVIGGLSMGGYVAQSFIRQFSGDVKALILLNTKSAADNDQQKEGRNKMIDTVRRSGSAAVAQEMLPKMFSPKTQQNNPKLVTDIIAMMQSCPALTIEHALEAMRDRDDHVSFLPQINVPTLLITGDGDAITGPSVMGPMHKAIAGSTYVVTPNAGHLSPVENPTFVNDALASFLKKL